MTARTSDALASALPDGLDEQLVMWDTREIAAFQAERLAEAGYVLVHTAPDEATVERLARVLHAIEPDSLDWDEDLSPDWRDRYRFDVRKLFADLAGTSAQARHTDGEQTPSPYELWRQADGDTERYVELMREHGHIIDREPGDDSPVLPCREGEQNA